MPDSQAGQQEHKRRMSLQTADPSPFAIGRRLRPSPSASILTPTSHPAAHTPLPTPPPLDLPPSDPPHPQPRPRASQATLSRLLKKPSLIGPFLRGMQSFDSGRTERPGTSASYCLPVALSAPETPPRAIPARQSNPVQVVVAGSDVWAWFAGPGEEDPRFVLWRSTTPSDPPPPPTPTFPQFRPSTRPEVDVTRILLASSLERWVHHLTSIVNPDASFDFLLVYRSFCSPGALLSLLTSRFEWACTPISEDEEDDDDWPEAERVLARSRTIMVLASWLANFFEEDWVRDVALRRQLTGWMNAMRAAKELDSVLGARGLLRKLKSVVKERKAAFDTPNGMSVYEAKAASFSASSDPSTGPRSSTSSSISPPNAFPPVFPTRRQGVPSFDSSAPAFHKHPISKLWGSIGRATRTKLSSAAGSSSTGSVRSTGATFSESSLDLFFDPSIVDSSEGPAVKGGLDAYLQANKLRATQQLPSASPTFSDPETRSSHSSTSTDDVRTTPQSSIGTSVDDEAGKGQPGLDAVEEERSSCELSPESRKISDSNTPRPPSQVDANLPPAATQVDKPSPVDSTFSYASRDVDTVSIASSASSGDSDFRVSSNSAGQESKPTWTPIVPFATIALDDVSLSDSDDDRSWHSRDSMASPRKLRQEAHQLNLRRTSVDMLDGYPAGVRRGSSDSIVSPTTGRPPVRMASTTSSASSDQGAWNNSLLARFDLEGIESDEEDDGGVEAALKRLNGDYDVEKRKAREAKIERLVAANRDAWKRHEPLPVRRRSIDFDLIEPSSATDVGLGPPLELQPAQPLMTSVEVDATLPLTTPTTEQGPAEEVIATVVHPSLPTLAPPPRRLSAPSPQRPTVHSPTSSAPTSTLITPRRARASTQESQTKVNPLALLASPSKAARRSLVKRRVGPMSPGAAPGSFARSMFPSIPSALKHQSFILSFKTNVLAAQFSMIDAQLLNAVGFEELARKPAPWLANPLPKLDVWEDLWREKARWKIDKEGRPSDVSMLVRRFELVVRWVETEVVLTARSGRTSLLAIVERFIKLAAALFQMSNLQSCVAIMTGLQTPLISNLMQAHKAWSKLSLWEKRVFKDLRLITSPDANWANLRKAHASILEKHGGRLFENALLAPMPVAGLEGVAPSKSLTGATKEDGFLPFMSIYLQDLRNLDIYPDFVSPRIPEAVQHHLPPLPSCLSSGTSLINVDKATQHAQIIREVCLFKTLSARFSAVPAETVPFQLCFKLRAAPSDVVANLAQIATPR